MKSTRQMYQHTFMYINEKCAFRAIEQAIVLGAKNIFREETGYRQLTGDMQFRVSFELNKKIETTDLDLFDSGLNGCFFNRPMKNGKLV